ncbi:hypothetical protein ACLEPN_05495 [Myxococcus sp. 1LA]
MGIILEPDRAAYPVARLPVTLRVDGAEGSEVYLSTPGPHYFAEGFRELRILGNAPNGRFRVTVLETALDGSNREPEQVVRTTGLGPAPLVVPVVDWGHGQGVLRADSSGHVLVSSGSALETSGTAPVVVQNKLPSTWNPGDASNGAHWIAANGNAVTSAALAVPFEVGRFQHLELCLTGGLTGGTAPKLTAGLEFLAGPLATDAVVELLTVGDGSEAFATAVVGSLVVGPGVVESATATRRRVATRHGWCRVRYDVTGAPTGMSASLRLLGYA